MICKVTCISAKNNKEINSYIFYKFLNIYVEKGNPKIGVYVELLGYSYVNVDIKDVKPRKLMTR